MRIPVVEYAAAFAMLAIAPSAIVAQHVALWRDPGPIASLDLAAGPGGAGNQPAGPFAFVDEEKRGINLKVIVTDSRGRKWIAKFGEEAKAEVFASRVVWAAGYPVRTSYYLREGIIQGVPSGGASSKFIGQDGRFQAGARFQLFDNERFHEVEGGALDLRSRDASQRELTGLKLTALLLGNWDLKRANTAVFSIDGKQYATIADWGASLGDPGATDRSQRKWNCQEYGKDTQHLLDGVENGYVAINYEQYAGRHVDVLSKNIRQEDLKWFTDRMSKLTDAQIRAALRASGATPEEEACFTAALRDRIRKFEAVATGNGPSTTVTRTRTVTTSTTSTAGEQKQKR